MSTYCRTHGVLKTECGCDFTCDQARAIRLRLTGQTPHTPTPAELRELAEPDAPAGTRTRAAAPRSDADAGTGASGARTAGRGAYRKPKVVRGLTGWFYHCHTCRRGTCHGSQPAAFAAALEHVRDHHKPQHRYFPNSPAPTACPCLACLEDAGVDVWWFVVCDECGNKRCPHATDHNFPCSGSNDPGQLKSNPRDGGPVDLDELEDQTDPAQAMWSDALNRTHNNPGGRS